MKQYLNSSSLHPELTANVSRHNNIAVFATICGTIFVLQGLYSLAPLSVLGSWVVLQVVFAVFRLIAGDKLYRCKEMDVRWHRITWLYIFSILLSGITMGWAAVLADMYGDVEQQLFVFAILIGFTGAAVATLSPVIQASVTYLVGIMVPQIVVLFFQFGETEMFQSRALESLMGYLSLLYLIIIIRACFILYNTFFESIQLKQDLAKAKELAESANQAKSTFLSSVSHELRTPLHAIMGSTQLLEMDNQDEAQRKQFLGLIKQAGEHLLTLIDQILEFAKIEAGKIKLEVAEVSLHDLLDDCDGLTQSMADKNNIKLEVIKPEVNVTFVSDNTRLKQILLNLISNAIKYNNSGGEVVVSVSNAAKGKLRISVRDNGFGIPDAQKASVFVAFNRLGRESGEKEGTGIGLSICKDLIEQMGGTLNFTSEEEKGSEFWIEMDTSYFDNLDQPQVAS